MMNEGDKKRLLAMVALARKAGKLVTGEDSCIKAMRDGKARLVLLALDASGNTQKKFRDKAAFYGCDIVSNCTKDEIGRHTGLHNRAAVVVADESFANKMREIISRAGE